MESRRAIRNLEKTVSFVFTSKFPMVMSVLLHLILLIPFPLNPLLMLFISAFSDFLIGIGFAREELEPTERFSKPIKNKSKLIFGFQRFFISCLIIGAIEVAAGFFSFFTSMSYFGFKFDSYENTLFKKAFNGTGMTYNQNLTNLGNSNLD